MAEVTAPEPRRERTRLTDQQHDQPPRPMDVEVEALALLTLGKDLRELLARRSAAGQTPSEDEVAAIAFVKDRLARLPREATAQPGADGPSRTPATSGSAASAATIQWQDEFLNLLVRAGKKVKRWLDGADGGTERFDPVRVPAPDARLSPELRDLPDVSSLDRLSDLYDRTSTRLSELLDQSPALRRLSSNGDLNGVSRHLPRRGVDGEDRSLGGGPTNRFQAFSSGRSIRRGREDRLPPPEPGRSGHVQLQQSRPRSVRR
ncbi:hypothetical protein AB0F49_10025 [Micromonospora ureilytica]|uniref:hypothetical protein n=1 Tax=Micromonospora ureilytica TaxID=709868 RepID=UPI0033C97306